MRSYEVSIDVTGKTDLPGALATAVTIHVPDSLPDSATVMFGFPGGGFGRRYYDVKTLPGYSQAGYHTAAGHVFVACDHLHVGESSHPDIFSLTYENLAAANHATSETVLEGLSKGTLAEGLAAVIVDKTIAMGQSMGGCLLTVQQARHRSFDAVALLGWSGIYTNFPAPDGSRMTFPMPPRGTDLRPIADQVLGVVAPDDSQFRYCFHWPDEEEALIEADLATYDPYSDAVRGDETTPWGSSTIPACAVTMMTEGSVRDEAAAIDVPVLSASGERDVVPDPWAEPSAYRSSRLIMVAVIERMAHMHNFARTRTKLWDIIDGFTRTVDTGER